MTPEQSHSGAPMRSEQRPPPHLPRPSIMVVVELLGAAFTQPEVKADERDELFHASRDRHAETLSRLIHHNGKLASRLNLSVRLEQLRNAQPPTGDLHQPVDTAALERALAALPPQEIMLAFRQLLGEIDKTGPYFQYLKDLGLFDALKQGFTQPALGMRFQFSGTEELIVRGKTMPSHYAAVYLPESHAAYFRGSPPSETALWAQLATNGALPEVIEHIHHEHVHGLQRMRLPPIWFLKHAGLGAAVLTTGAATMAGASLFATLTLALGTTLAVDSLVTRYLRSKNAAFDPVPRALRELQAYMAMEESPSCYRAPRTPVEHIGHITAQITSEEASTVSSPFDSEIPLTTSRVATAVTGAGGTLQALRDLGVSHQDLAQILRSPRYDPTTASFPALEQRLKKERAEYNLTDDKSFTDFRRAIRFERCASWAASREQSMHLARSALRSLGVSLPRVQDDAALAGNQ